MKYFPPKNKEVSLNSAPHQSGFTLIELITVIVILSIIATIGTGFVVKTTESYQRTQTRALLVNTARQALERMTRQLRGALPYSVRITNGGNCAEFMPIAAGGNYLIAVPDQENGVATKNTVSVAPFTVDFGTARFVSIGAMQASEIYGASPASLAGYSNASAGTLTLAGTKRWQRNSINKRFYILDNPQAFCVVGTELRFYQNINVLDPAINVAGAFDVIARNVAATTPFVLQNGSENRNTRIDVSLNFTSGGETINFTQGVFIRNVP